MPRSSAAEMSALRDAAMMRDGGCCWPGCRLPRTDAWGYENNPLEMAHLTHRGMGGSKYANRLENVAMLCKTHHDALDGRTALGTLRFELNEMLRFVVGSVEP
jgi:hypothetical protein